MLAVLSSLAQNQPVARERSVYFHGYDSNSHIYE